MQLSEIPTMRLWRVSDAPVVSLARAEGWRIEAASEETDSDQGLATVVLLLGCAEDPATEKLRRTYPQALIVAPSSPNTSAQIDLTLSGQEDPNQLRQLLKHSADHWRQNCKVMNLVREVGMRRHRMHQLSEIGIALSSRMELEGLLDTILSEARRLAHCEGASLYLVEADHTDQQTLVFKLAQNDAIPVSFVESRLPLTSESLAGYTALSGEELNLKDAYDLPAQAPYVFNRSFDERMGYRTRSLLLLPMHDRHGYVVGVLQFINRVNPQTGEIETFGEEIAELLRAIASQAAVSIQKNTLIRDMNQLFESFVQASIKTIERRDPSTSGHSFRVAEKTVALLEALPKSGIPQFRNIDLSDESIREVRYAALLHDFGKIGVREDILVKANKLTDERLEILRYRIELHKERLRRGAVEQELHLLHQGSVDAPVAIRRIHREMNREMSRLDEFFDWIVHANTPNVLESGDFDHLRELREFTFQELDGRPDGLISKQDLLALSVRRGSLTPEEREAIQGHVIHTREFLDTLPWPPELAQVPGIAGAHHEKLDGTGYPLGLVGEQIPLPSRVMTVCDIYDALTAMDRPYKSAMSVDQALGILHQEARVGLIDGDMVRVFVAAGIHLIGRAAEREAG